MARAEQATAGWGSEALASAGSTVDFAGDWLAEGWAAGWVPGLAAGWMEGS